MYFNDGKSVTTKTTKLFSTLKEASVNRRDLRALTLAGPTRDNPSCTTPRHPTNYVSFAKQSTVKQSLSQIFTFFCKIVQVHI